ncbi:MAG: HEAT repeat domain-containing protein, partial [Planctomycetes bacterium]|nr:HEAT repeat domain-containing protein [Planctomycetota bacterium]
MDLRSTTFALAAALLPAATAAAQDAAADLRSKDVAVQLAAIDAIAAANGDVPLILPGLLKDKDWEVQERAAMALGKLGHAASLPQLATMAQDGDVFRVRRAAALAVSAIDAAAGAERIAKKLKGKDQIAALEALAFVLRGHPGFAEIDKIEALVAAADAEVREPAAVAFLEGAADRAAALRKLLGDRHLGV